MITKFQSLSAWHDYIMPETVNYRQWTGKDIENIKYDDFTGFNGRSIEDCKLNNQEMADKVNKYLDTLKNKTKTKMKTWQETGDFQPERYMDNRKPFIAKKRQAKSKKIYNPLHILFTAFQYRIINFYQFLMSIISYFCYFYVGKYSKFLTKAHFWIVYKLINP